MTSEGIYLKKVDRRTYRKLKSMAAEKGVPVYEVLNEAIADYVDARQAQGAPGAPERRRQGSDLSTEMDANNDAYVSEKERLLRDYAGRYVVFFDGAFKGSADGLEGAAKIIRESGRPKALMVKVGEDVPTGGDWLWSSLELFAA